MDRVKVKICGITDEAEIRMINEAGVEFAGFVFAAKSKRYISLQKAAVLKEHLAPGIKAVAVTVSPDLELAQKIRQAGFDILQVHGALEPEVAKQAKLPIWRAVNFKDMGKTCGDGKTVDFEDTGEECGDGKTMDFEDTHKECGDGKTVDFEDTHKTCGDGKKGRRAAQVQLQLSAYKTCPTLEVAAKIGLTGDELNMGQIEAVLFDAGQPGSGKTYSWENEEILRVRDLVRQYQKTFVLAGGLNADNVAQGIRIFSPDIVDVSSGVENDGAGPVRHPPGKNDGAGPVRHPPGKNEDKIRAFLKSVEASTGE